MLQNGRASSCRVSEGHIPQANLVRAFAVHGLTARGQSARGTHRGLKAQHRSDRCSGSVERPTESAEGDHRDADGALHIRNGFAKGDSSVRRTAGQGPEHGDIRAYY